MIEEDGDQPRDPPLLRRAADDAAQHLPRPRDARGARAARCCEYGNAIRDLATANIFPGDLLWRNFGVTRYGRVVFYDYDEIEYLTDVTFRRIPPPPNPEAELAGEPWYGVARNDVFPEEFATFLLGDPRLREHFLRHHADLLEPEFWQECQRRVEAARSSTSSPTRSRSGSAIEVRSPARS